MNMGAPTNRSAILETRKENHKLISAQTHRCLKWADGCIQSQLFQQIIPQGRNGGRQGGRENQTTGKATTHPSLLTSVVATAYPKYDPICKEKGFRDWKYHHHQTLTSSILSLCLDNTTQSYCTLHHKRKGSPEGNKEAWWVKQARPSLVPFLFKISLISWNFYHVPELPECKQIHLSQSSLSKRAQCLSIPTIICTKCHCTFPSITEFYSKPRKRPKSS